MVFDGTETGDDLRRLPLNPLYEGTALGMSEVEGWLLPKGFRPLEDELSLLNAGIGVVDFSDRGRLELTGKDSIDFLHRVSTNDVRTVDSRRAIQTLLLNEKGKVIDSLFVVKAGERVRIITSRGSQQKVKEWLERFIISDDVSVRETTGDTAVLLRITEGDEVRSAGMASAGASFRTKLGDLGAELLLADSDDSVLAKLGTAGYVIVGVDAYEYFRILHGIPAWRKEMAGEFNPLEMHLRNQISFEKGCYIGQEVVARLDTYQKVQRRLCLVRWSGEDPPGEASALNKEGKECGMFTSRAPSYGPKGIGLAVVRKEFAAVGTEFTVDLGTTIVIERVFDA